ncbi:hairy-related 12 [Xiphophorus hellerii]|uniref:hairy-related 12 n=1 Tax=Xiphophorus hellerii TaxID=8084 RepID=UPI0013B37FBE|nr:enhancer of split m3 protein-like [Xiphophorus hellerii]
MSPCPNSYSSIHHLRMSERDNIKLRKPIVEKMRRDRINTCIEQLKVILEKEFHKQEPNSKLEKADILEMTVSFLRQQLQVGSLSELLPLPEGLGSLPVRRLNHGGLGRTSAGPPAARADAPSDTESQQLLPAQTRLTAGQQQQQQQQQQRPGVEAVVERLP